MELSQFKKEVGKIKRTTGSVVVALQLAQSIYGQITPESVEIIADLFGQSRCTVYSTATFYHQFSFVPKGKHVVSVCMGTACFVCGASDIMSAIEEELSIKAGEITPDKLFSIEYNTRCVGRCDIAPVVMINDQTIERATVKETLRQIRKIKNEVAQ